VGGLSTNCYVTSCLRTREAVIIDPGFEGPDEANSIFSFIEKKELILKLIIDTHGHPDHVCGNELVKKKFSVPIAVHEADAFMFGESGKKVANFFGFDHTSPSPDILLHDNEVLKFGKTELTVIHTPGHSAGSVVLVGEREIFTGDTLFEGSIGRTDFPWSSEADMMLSLKKLSALQDDLAVYPGHGSPTTMGQEKRLNPFMQQV
jgi:hydroxyacylglutathione hydrolase